MERLLNEVYDCRQCCLQLYYKRLETASFLGQSEYSLKVTVRDIVEANLMQL
jgi:hypothetical protein